MTTKITADQVPSPRRRTSRESDPYGDRWGAGPAATPHNRPGSIASDPTSAPRSQSGLSTRQDAEAPAPSPQEEGALREQQEQGWDSEGGAAYRPRR